MNWWKNLKGKVKLNEPLSKHTSFRIGAEAEFFIEPSNIDDLKRLISYIKKQKAKLLIIGSGSNILAPDNKMDAVVARLNSAHFRKISSNRNFINVGSGFPLGRLVRFALNNKLSGLEFLMGLPGTVGGALVMNAGAGKKSIGDLVAQITVMDYNGRIKIIRKKDINFGYRVSGLGKYIILGARLKLKHKEKSLIRQELKKYIDYRRSTQELGLPSAGCIFKNPKNKSAGKLIDLCALKGKHVGGAYVSLKHANFILNKANASAKDVLKLKALIEKKVKSKFGITLKPEIKIWQ